MPGAILGGLSLNAVPFLSQTLKVCAIGKCGAAGAGLLCRPYRLCRLCSELRSES